MYKGESLVGRIYENWLDEESPCSECPIYDERGCRAPFYGHGTFNEVGEVDVMVIGEAPGSANQEDTPGTEREHRSCEKFIQNKRKNRIYDGFDPNSPYFEYLADGLQAEFNAVYFTNLMKCYNLEEQDSKGSGSWVDTDRLSSSCEYQYDAEKGLVAKGNLNKKAKQNCSHYLEREISVLNPSVVICLGKNHIAEAYDVLGIEVPDIPAYLDNHDYYCTEIHSENTGLTTSTTVIPSYHFSQQFFGSNISNCDFVDDDADARIKREMYWDRVIDIAKSAFSQQ